MRLARRLAPLLLLAACSVEPPPHNVLIVSIDSLRHDYLGCTGDPRGATPWMDRLAAEGILFENALATSSWTLPSHMSLLTGQYPASHGVTGDGRSLPPEKESLAEILGGRGYRTAGFVSGPYLHRSYGFDQGFEVYEHCVNYGEELNEKGRVANVIRVNQRSHQGLTSPRLDDRTGKWLRELPRGEPFLLFVHYWDPHYDYIAPFPYDTWLDPGFSDRFHTNGFLQNRKIHAEMPARHRRRMLDLYRGEIRYTDGFLGRLLQRLEERGDLSRTIVVLVSDHGEEFFEHGNKGHRINLYEETLRIPMLIRYPDGRGAGTIVREPVSLVDVAPTVLAALSLETPDEIQGTDLARAASGGLGREGVVGELHQSLDAWRTASWKLILDRASGASELYALDVDPGESSDQSEAEPEVVERLRAELAATNAGLHAPDSVGVPALDEATENQLKALGYTD